MKRNQKKLVIIVSLSILLITILVVSFTLGKSLLIGEKRAEYLLNENKNDIFVVAEFLKNSEHKYIFIYDSSGSMYVGYTVKIEDEAVIEALENLFDKNYKSIEKNENTIHFLRWTRLMNYGSGIAYSINGIDEPFLPHLTKIVPLSETGWYYYEENYNER